MQTPIKTLQIIHLALVAGVTMVYLVIGQIYTLDFLKLPELNNTVLVFMFGAILAVLLSNLAYNHVLKQESSPATFQKQFSVYQTATIIRLAILEGTAFLILFLQQDVLILGLLLIIYMLWLRPSETRMKHYLNQNRLL